MPYADKEKEREAKRRYDKKRQGKRSQNWAIIAYPESLPANWKSILEETMIPVLVSPLHCDDVNPDGEVKKEHYHILLRFSTLKSLDYVQTIADDLNAPRPEKVDDYRGYARYLCHLDNPSKAQYDPAEVMEFNGADYLGVIQLSSEKYELIAAMCDWCDENLCTSYAQLCRYARNSEPTWWRALCDNCSWQMAEYCKSLEWEKTNTDNWQD